ncbi:MAG: hypothetical protein ACRDKS_08305 [Actinomycetota bacterium]
MTLAISVLEISFILLLLFMLGLSGVIGLVVITRMVEPRGVKALSQRLTGFPRDRAKEKHK